MISVIIPVFNQAEYLTDAIESVLAQSEPALEIIVIDDGSTDSSSKIADSYKPKGVQVVHQVNKGLASARNTGIMRAIGSYIFPLDSDDLMKENCLERLTDEILRTNADMIAPSFKCFGKQNGEVVLDKDPKLEDFLKTNKIGYFSAIKRSALLEVGGYNPRMTWGWEDWDLWIDLLKRGKILVTIPDVLVLYRTKETSMITEANKHSKELQEQMRKNHPELKWPESL